MAGILAQLPGGEVQFVPVAPQILIGCLSEVAHRLRRVLSPALGFEKQRCLQQSSCVEDGETAACLPESEEEELAEEYCLPAEQEDEEFRLLFQGRDLEDESTAASFLKVFESGRPCMVRILFRLLGGKGGFGALLRSQKGGKKTTNFDAMRDLNGRRIRHVKAVERIKGWLEKKKRDDELVNLLTGEGPELPKPTPESESLDPEFVRKLKRAAETRPSVVNEGLRHLLAEAGGSSESTAEAEVAKRSRKDGDGPATDSTGAAADRDSVDWLGALAALDELSSPDGEDEEGAKEAAAPAASSSSSLSSSQPSSHSAASNQDTAEASPDTAKKLSSRVSASSRSDAKPQVSGSATKAPPPPAAVSKGPASMVQPATVTTQKDEVELVKPEHLHKYSSAEELASKVPAEALKQSLQQLGLKCGGRPEERAKRLFELKGKALKDLPKSFFAAPAKN